MDFESKLEEWGKYLGLSHLIRKRERILHHFVLLSVNQHKVGTELTSWGEAPWWPKLLSVKYTREGDAPLQLGTVYKKETRIAALPFILKSQLSVTEYVPDQRIEWTYQKGVISGKEVITIEGRYNGTKLSYDLIYRVKGIFNRIIWFLFMHSTQRGNVGLILDSLKQYLETESEKKDKA